MPVDTLNVSAGVFVLPNLKERRIKMMLKSIKTLILFLAFLLIPLKLSGRIGEIMGY
jgi:hypothetical protein